jgi:hypothetical protein
MMTETVQLLLSICALGITGAVLLFALATVIFVGVRVYPVIAFFFETRKLEKTQYVHPETGKPCSLDEALVAEESMFSGDVALSSWRGSVTRQH